jgi:hypothetical protein
VDFREIVSGGKNRIDLTENRNQWGGSYEHGNERSGSIKCLEVLE